jgi:cation:H+ antiporter
MIWTDLLGLAIGLVLLFFGGEGLVKGSSALALRLGMTPLVAGLTVVAFGTSAPELVVSVKAALAGQGAIALGNVIGSNIFNIGFILGLTALIFPLKVENQIVRFDVPILIAVTLGSLVFLWDFALGRAEGAGFFLGLIGYIGLSVWMAKKVAVSRQVEQEYAEAVPKPAGKVVRDLAFILGGLALLVIGSRFFVSGATGIARGLGVSEAIIGLTIVACGTSMPELAASIVAALRKEPDIALGNIVGSNIFNLLGILGVSALIAPLSGPGLQHTDLYVMTAFALVLLPMVWSGFRLVRWEGAVLLAGYGAYLWMLWPK